MGILGDSQLRSGSPHQPRPGLRFPSSLQSLGTTASQHHQPQQQQPQLPLPGSGLQHLDRLSRTSTRPQMRLHQMSDYPKESVLAGGGADEGPVDRPSPLDPFQKKVVLASATTANAASASASQHLASSTSSSSSSSRVAKRVQHHSTSSTSHHSSSSSSSHLVSSEMKASSVKSDLSELQSSITEMKNLSSTSSTQQSETTRSSNFKSLASAASVAAMSAGVRGTSPSPPPPGTPSPPPSLTARGLRAVSDEDVCCTELTDGSPTGCSPSSAEPLVTFPDPDTPPTPGAAALVVAGGGHPLSPHAGHHLHHPLANYHHHHLNATAASAASTSSSSEVKFEQKRMTTASKTKVVRDTFSAERATANAAEVKRVQAGDVSYSEQSAASAVRARLEAEGVTAEKATAIKQEQRTLKSGEITQRESQNMAATSMKLQTDSFSAEKKAMAAQQQRQTVTQTGMFNQEKHMATSSQSNITITAKSMCTKASSASSSSLIQSSQLSQQKMNGSAAITSNSPLAITSGEEELLSQSFEDLERLCANSNPKDVQSASDKYSEYLSALMEHVRKLTNDGGGGAVHSSAPRALARVNEMMRKAWAVPTYGHELGHALCNALRGCNGLNLLIKTCVAADNPDLQFSSACLLEQCLTTENRSYVVETGLEKVVNAACVCTKNTNSAEHSRVGTGILEHLFKHSEGTCSDVIRLGGLDAVLFECRKNDIETLRHCAGALANLSLYGGAENQEAMIKRKVPMWLFPLAFHNDDNIKYYACLAIAVLVANKEIEAAVLKSGTLDLVEPFVTSHNPYEFARSNLAHAHGQSKSWLQRLAPVLSSKREEARNLAAFHFCMEAGIKKRQGNTEVFREIGAIEPLKKVASCPNAVASKFAAQALRLINEDVPHKLSQQVPLWSTEDVQEWVKQIGFAEYAHNFVDSRVDGDLLLQLAEENLRDDIGITNGIRRRRFTRELQNLKKMADYSSRDTGNLNTFLLGIGPEFTIYTYSMLNAGVDKDSIRCLSEEQLVNECGITNSIHRIRILDSIRGMECGLGNFSEEDLDKSLDVFVSYRRSNGSQLASLLKVHLQLRGFSVFIDVERLEAGKFDNNLLQSIRQAKHFLLVLTPKALERCIGDTECKDWVHREIVAALQSQCNIIPIIDNFQWPEPEELPEDMRAVCHFNGVRWIHDYQDACVDKLERFMRGEMPMRSDMVGGPLGRVGGGGGSVTGGPKGDATPGTPSSSSLGRQPPSYQRMHSNESGKGSDKDINGNSSSSGIISSSIGGGGGGGGGRD
ncbi:NAD(+) hydrolase sarm1 [Hetaerina americana]|uniref:NAD(+) hydrolase sarm1 n=1 Tax=Hetaerina americana TaxID=62018 RepID=UPI003A7F2FB5